MRAVSPPALIPYKIVSTLRDMWPHGVSMMDVSIRELKNHLSEYLRRVQAGEEITVTSRGRAVARLSAIVGGHSRSFSGEEGARRLDVMSWIVRPRAPGSPEGVGALTQADAEGPSSDEIMDWVRGK